MNCARNGKRPFETFQLELGYRGGNYSGFSRQDLNIEVNTGIYDEPCQPVVPAPDYGAQERRGEEK